MLLITSRHEVNLQQKHTFQKVVGNTVDFRYHDGVMNAKLSEQEKRRPSDVILILWSLQENPSQGQASIKGG